MSDAIDIQASLIVEVERLRLVNKRLNRRAQSAEAAADAKAEDWNKRAAGSQLRNHYYVRAIEAEAEAKRLHDEIERLKGYVTHKQECRKGKPRMESMATLEGCYLLQNGYETACTCGLAPETGAT